MIAAGPVRTDPDGRVDHRETVRELAEEVSNVTALAVSMPACR